MKPWMKVEENSNKTHLTLNRPFKLVGSLGGHLGNPFGSCLLCMQ